MPKTDNTEQTNLPRAVFFERDGVSVVRVPVPEILAAKTREESLAHVDGDVGVFAIKIQAGVRWNFKEG